MLKGLRNAATCAIATAAIVTALHLHGAAEPQAPRPAEPLLGSSATTSFGNFSPIVEDLERSLGFYRDLLGLNVAGAPEWRGFKSDQRLLNLHGTLGARLRFVQLTVPGAPVAVELVEYKDIDRVAVQPRFQDPGNTNLTLFVRDLDALVARLKSGDVVFVTPGAAPVEMAGNSRAILVKDPDGRYVEFLQPNPLPDTTAPATSNIIGSRVTVTVADTDRSVAFYRDVLGLKARVGTLAASKAMEALTGLKNAQFRFTTLSVPDNATASMNLVEVHDVDRMPLRTHIQDAGSTRLQVRVRDIEATLKTVTAAGIPVLSTGGKVVDLGGPTRAAVVRDPNNLFLVLISEISAPQGTVRARQQ